MRYVPDVLVVDGKSQSLSWDDKDKESKPLAKDPKHPRTIEFLYFVLDKLYQPGLWIIPSPQGAQPYIVAPNRLRNFQRAQDVLEKGPQHVAPDGVRYVLLDGSGGLTIGDCCSISTGVQIYTHDTVKWAVSGGKAEYERAPTKIGDCCYIGPHTVIVKGVTIGEHSVVGACGFVNRDIPPYSIVVGIPGRVVGQVVLHDDGKVDFNYPPSDRP